MSRLIRWDTPFTEAFDPSVGIYFQHGEDETDLVTAIVAPHGIDKYPKYLIHFGRIIEVNCHEEAYSPERLYESAEVEVKDICAYNWLDSPSIVAYEKGLPFVTPTPKDKITHYILVGGDNIVEVVTQNIPEIEMVNEPRSINIELKV